MQIWQAERAGSQSQAGFNRGRSKFRGTEFGAKKKKAVLLLLLLYGEQRSEVDGLEAQTGSDSASEGDNKSVKLNETRNFLDTGLLDLLIIYCIFLE